MHDHFRRALEDCDVALARKIWARAMPHLPQPKNDDQALVMVHHARTQANSITFKLRAYSHRWLSERGFPSGLPEELKPRAERLYPKPVIMAAVGIAVKSNIAEVATGVRCAMEEAVMDVCDGRSDKLLDTDQLIVRGRMFEARDRMRRFYRDLLRRAG